METRPELFFETRVVSMNLSSEEDRFAWFVFSLEACGELRKRIVIPNVVPSGVNVDYPGPERLPELLPELPGRASPGQRLTRPAVPVQALSAILERTGVDPCRRSRSTTVEVTVEPGTLLLDACKQVGIDIPHYCYHPALTPVATCRMCMVEIKGQPKLATSCTTTAAEGMEVFTDSPAVADARAGVMEFLLMNHPLDCPICDQAGECKLQDYSYQYGSGDSRMVEPKRRYRYEDLGAKIVIDKNRCIHCTRCVRFTQEISGTSELTVANRGAAAGSDHLRRARSMDSNPLAGNVVDLCPVGALTSRDFRFTKRVWYLKPDPHHQPASAHGQPHLGRCGREPGLALPPAAPGGAARHLLHPRRGALQLSPLRPGSGDRA